MMQVGQFIREDGPKDHLQKGRHAHHGRGADHFRGQPVSTLLWTDLTNRYVWIVLLATLGFGAIGFFDDYLMQVKKRSLGLSGPRQIAAAGTAGIAGGTFGHTWYPSFPPSSACPFSSGCPRIRDGATFFSPPWSSWGPPTP